MAIPQTIQVVVTPKQKREIADLAKREKRSLSNMAMYLLWLGKMKFQEEKAKDKAA